MTALDNNLAINSLPIKQILSIPRLEDRNDVCAYTVAVRGAFFCNKRRWKQAWHFPRNSTPLFHLWFQPHDKHFTTILYRKSPFFRHPAEIRPCFIRSKSSRALRLCACLNSAPLCHLSCINISRKKATDFSSPFRRCVNMQGRKKNPLVSLTFSWAFLQIVQK